MVFVHVAEFVKKLAHQIRIDSFRLTEEKQLEFIKSLSNALPTYKGVPHKPSETTEVTRSYFTTDYDRCIYCGRCEKYCPTGTIQVTLDRDEGICSDCGLCSDVCPNGAMNKNHIVNKKHMYTLFKLFESMSS